MISQPSQLPSQNRSVLLFIGGIHPQLRLKDLHSVLSSYAELYSLRLVPSTKKDRSRGFGFITTSEAAAQVLSQAKIEIWGKLIDIMISEEEVNQQQNSAEIMKLYFAVNDFKEIDKYDAKLTFSSVFTIKKFEIEEYKQRNSGTTLYYGWIEYFILNPNAYDSRIPELQSPYKYHTYTCFPNKRKIQNAMRSFSFRINRWTAYHPPSQDLIKNQHARYHFQALPTLQSEGTVSSILFFSLRNLRSLKVVSPLKNDNYRYNRTTT